MDRKDLSEAGKMLVAARRVVQGQCVICGKPFSGTNRRKYCNPVCNMRAYRARKRERDEGDERD